MKYGILADIHSNLEAFQAVLAFLKKNRVEVMVIAGDVLGYGASPLECLQLLAGEQSVACVRGNHEEALLSGEFSRMRPEAVTSLIWTRQQLNRFWIDYLASFPFIICGANFALCHGAADRPLSGYLTSRDRAKRAFAARLHRICFCGHTHFPCVYRQKEDSPEVELIPADFNGCLKVKLEPGWSYLINVGSVGQPRDGLPVACAGVYDTGQEVFFLERIEYRVEVARERILTAGLPAFLGERLCRGV